MKLIAKISIGTGKENLKPGTEFDTQEHGISDEEAQVLILRKFATEAPPPAPKPTDPEPATEPVQPESPPTAPPVKKK